MTLSLAENLWSLQKGMKCLEQKISTHGFGAYDIRGIYPEEINEELAYRIGRVFSRLFGARRVAVGHDIRLSGSSLQEALMRGIAEAGCDAVDIGQCGTEMIYFAAGFCDMDGGIMITASHNPKEYNGMKFVRRGARPISGENGLNDIKRMVVEESFEPQKVLGKIEKLDLMQDYVAHLLTYVDVEQLKPYRIVVNAGNGAAGAVLDELEKHLPVEMIKVNHEPDGNFPNGVPNPLLLENREATAKAVIAEGADLGIAWDGDFDRCFVFDENGNIIEGYYMVGFLAEAFLKKNRGARIIHDPRLVWNTVEVVEQAQGHPIVSKSGHAFIKEKMREEDAVYGGEMSAHHYFRDFCYCDSGMIPWLLVLELLSKSGGRTMSELIRERQERYPISGEINRKVKDAAAVMEAIERIYGATGKVTHVDGLSVEYDNWRFNLRKSNTEPLLRLNVESRQDAGLLKEKTEELLEQMTR